MWKEERTHSVLQGLFPPPNSWIFHISPLFFFPLRLFNFLVSPLFFALPPENSENVSSPHIPDKFFFEFQPDTVILLQKEYLDKIERNNKQSKNGDHFKINKDRED